MWWPETLEMPVLSDELARLLLQAVLAQDFAATPDKALGGAPMRHFPSIDLAVADFTPGRSPRWANLLFSREYPGGVLAEIGSDAGTLRNIRFERDLQDAAGISVAWQPDTDWRDLHFLHLHGQGTRFVAPYTASLLKLMVAVGVGMAIDRGLIDTWPAALEPMIVVSSNEATDECVALLHRCGLLVASGDTRSTVNAVNATFAACGLPTLQLNDTTAAGGWRNGDGSGVGHIHMTAWDTVRLLWLLDAQAPPAPWLPVGAGLLQPASRDHLRELLQRQQLDEVLSSGSLRDVPGWVPGLPDAPAFAHKTGTTENYASDAGIVQTGDAHYIVALFSNLGDRYAPHERCATTWRVPALGAALHAALAAASDPAGPRG